MALFIPPQPTIGEAWFQTLEQVHARGGGAVHVLSTVTDPAGADHAGIRAAADTFLVEQHIGKHHVQPIHTVANTIFPSALYRPPAHAWSPAIDKTPDGQALDAAASRLYDRYRGILPSLLDYNNTGTYFARMIAWENRRDASKPESYNQLEARIRMLRSKHKARNQRFNAADIVVAGDGELEAAAGVQAYASTDERSRGFPCLVHVDLSLVDGRLNLLGVYRHQYLVTKAYGNMLGLAHLQTFVAQQTGFAVGELSILASFADAEKKIWTKERRVSAILDSVSKAL